MRKSSSIFLIAVGLILLVSIVLLSRDVLVLRISLPHNEGQIVYRKMASPGTELRMHYIHSVERTPVQGIFALDSHGGFKAVRTLTTGTGTGLPNVVDDQHVSMQGKWMVIDEGNTPVPRIPFYYLPLNNLRISVGDQEVDLNRVPPGSRLLITNEKKTLAEALAGKLPP
ncbi:MAG: DUF1850 domain-containing protein [Desulfovermiculus sp.]|nr:DUF1850 domain-containing protein [Desulfovermiculus sp.]